jgi:hypothetical protein
MSGYNAEERLGKIRINITLVIHTESDTDMDTDEIGNTFMEQVNVPNCVSANDCDIVMDKIEWVMWGRSWVK